MVNKLLTQGWAPHLIRLQEGFELFARKDGCCSAGVPSDLQKGFNCHAIKLGITNLCKGLALLFHHEVDNLPRPPAVDLSPAPNHVSHTQSVPVRKNGRLNR